MLFKNRRIWETRFHLTHVDWGGVTDSGSRGPLVRFDQSPLPPLICPSRGGASGDRCQRTASFRGHIRAGKDLPLLGGPSGGRRIVGGGGSRRRRAPRRRGGFDDRVIFWLRWSPAKIERGVVFARGRKSSWWRDWRGRGPGGDGIDRG